MQNTLTFTGVLFDDAKEILSAAYEADKAATFVNDLHLHGSVLDARITKNIEKSNSKLSWFDVNINSDSVSSATLKEMFADQIYKFC